MVAWSSSRILQPPAGYDLMSIDKCVINVLQSTSTARRANDTSRRLASADAHDFSRQPFFKACLKRCCSWARIRLSSIRFLEPSETNDLHVSSCSGAITILHVSCTYSHVIERHISIPLALQVVLRSNTCQTFATTIYLITWPGLLRA